MVEPVISCITGLRDKIPALYDGRIVTVFRVNLEFLCTEDFKAGINK